MIIETQLDLKDVVYLVVADEKRAGMITGINFRGGGYFAYEVTWSNLTTSWHQGCELTTTYIPDYVDLDGQTEDSDAG